MRNPDSICIHCMACIPEERAVFLAERGSVFTCTKCSTERHAHALTVYNGKTAPELVVVGTNPESVRLAQRVFRRAR